MISSIPTNLSPATLASPDALSAVIEAIALSVNVSSSSIAVGSADKLCSTNTNAASSIKLYSTAETQDAGMPSSSLMSEGFVAAKNITPFASNPSSAMLSFSINHPISGMIYYYYLFDR